MPLVIRKNSSAFILAGLFLASMPSLGYAFAYNTVNEHNEIILDSQDSLAIAWEEKTVAFTLDFIESRFVGDILAAMQEWNDVEADIDLVKGNVRADKCNDNDGVNHVTMTADNCGEVFGDILGITSIRSVEIGGADYIIDSDIRFQKFSNKNDRWVTRFEEPNDINFSESSLCFQNVNDGKTCDFYRVALHELGHAIGLGHPDELDQEHAAVMNTGASHLAKPFQLSTDDRAAINYLYPPERLPQTQEDVTGVSGDLAISATSNGSSSGGGGAFSPLYILLLSLISIVLKNRNWRQ